MRCSRHFGGSEHKTYSLCVSLLFLICATAAKSQVATEPHPKPSATPPSVYSELFLGCGSGVPCTRQKTFPVDPVPSGSCLLAVRNGDGRGTDEARSYEVFLNGERVIPVHHSGNAQVRVKVLSNNTLKVVLTGESFRKVFVEILCDAQGGGTDGRYPHELPEFRFYKTASWRSLEPLIATMNDVRRVLGNPQEAHDVSEYTKPYPGDEKALEPVFTYKLSSDWELLVYFTKYCFHKFPQGLPEDRVCSFDLVPAKRVSLDLSKLPAAFIKTHVQAVDAAWDEYSDGTGLRYEVYTTHPPYGSNEPGDLFRISYGPPKLETRNE